MKPVKNLLSREQIQQDLEQMQYDPESEDSLHQLLTHQVLKREYEGCLQTIDTIIEYHSGTSQLYLNRGLVLYRLGLLGEAIESVEKSLELDRDNQDAKTLLERLQYRLKAMRDYTCPIYQ
jgi:tetratricopeptide (TPR) repeat protein